VAEHADPGKVAEAVRDRLGGGQALFVVRKGELQRQTLQFVDDGFGYARSIEWITLIVALMGVMGTMLAVVLDRRRELGVFRALGATRLQVALAISAEAFALGLAAALLGTACGALQGFVLLKGVVGPNAQWDLEYVLPPLVVLRVVALVTLSTVMAALMPAYRAARIEVTRALTTE
jgi:putative ABC transport system permease protein